MERKKKNPQFPSPYTGKDRPLPEQGVEGRWGYCLILFVLGDSNFLLAL